MKKQKSMLIVLIVLVIIGAYNCTDKAEKKELTDSNPFFSEYTTPFKTPPFELIRLEHYLPAFKKAIAMEQAEIDKIVNNPQEPTFKNTILAYNSTGDFLAKVRRVFSTLTSADRTPELQKIAREVSPMMTKHRDNIRLNDQLFQRIKQVYTTRLKHQYDPLQIRVIEKNYNDFVRSGADLNQEDKEILKTINQEMSKLRLKFGENMLKETNTNFMLAIDKKEDLSGLPQGVIDAAAKTAADSGLKDQWVFTLQKPSLLPFLQFADNKKLREKLYRGYFMRGDNNDQFDNKEIMLNILKLRAKKAKLLGYDTYAEYAVADNMANTPQKIQSFLKELMEPAQAVAIRDRDDMQRIIDREGIQFKLDTWDWWYYAEKLKKEKFDLDESDITPYFVLSNVRDGMFFLANKLYGLNFYKLSDIPVYNPEVEVFEVKEADGSHLALLYLDYFPRSGKSVGAWCGSLRRKGWDKKGNKIHPLVTITTNFTRPNGDIPALLTYYEATILFHEFGHALHSMFADGKYSRIAGSVPRDMGELPASVMENWVGEPEVIKTFAKHYKTGKPMPEELLKKLQASITFNQAFTTVEYIGASVLDMDWHGITADQDYDVLSFEKESMKRLGIIKEILPRYRTSYFSHISGGYAAGYYVYLWGAFLDADAFSAFEETSDIFNKEVAARFRTHVLQDGGNGDGMTQYMKFRGKAPSIKALLKKRGLDQ